MAVPWRHVVPRLAEEGGELNGYFGAGGKTHHLNRFVIKNCSIVFDDHFHGKGLGLGPDIIDHQLGNDLAAGEPGLITGKSRQGAHLVLGRRPEADIINPPVVRGNLTVVAECHEDGLAGILGEIDLDMAPLFLPAVEPGSIVIVGGRLPHRGEGCRVISHGRADEDFVGSASLGPETSGFPEIQQEVWCLGDIEGRGYQPLVFKCVIPGGADLRGVVARVSSVAIPTSRSCCFPGGCWSSHQGAIRPRSLRPTVLWPGPVLRQQ